MCLCVCDEECVLHYNYSKMFTEDIEALRQGVHAYWPLRGYDQHTGLGICLHVQEHLPHTKTPPP